MTSRPEPASPSELPLPDSPAKTLRDFFWLLRAELFVLREEWFWYLLQASFVSLSYLAFLWFLIGPQAPSAAENLIVGSLVMSLSFAGMLSLGQHIGYLKELQAFDYYAALPLSKGAFIAALTTRGMLLSLPATLLIGFLAVVFFHVPFTGLSVLILFLSAYAMAGFGALIGFYSPTAQVASLLTQILQTLIIFFAPVYYPPSVLPEGLRLLAYLWPTTHAALALKGSLGGELNPSSLVSLFVLVLFCLVSLVLIPLRLDWRGRR